MKQFSILLTLTILSIPYFITAQDTKSISEENNGLEKLIGLYGDPEETNENHRLWVMLSCDGQLVSGALWGGAAAWWMKSEGNNVFTYEDSFSSIRMEFEPDNDGNAIKMIHDLSAIKTPLQRLGPIPGDWDPCLERPRR